MKFEHRGDDVNPRRNTKDVQFHDDIMCQCQSPWRHAVTCRAHVVRSGGAVTTCTGCQSVLPGQSVRVSFLLWSPCWSRGTLQSLVSQVRLRSPLTTQITLGSHCFGTAVRFHFKSQLCMFSSPDSIIPQVALIVTSWFQAIVSRLGRNMYVLTHAVPFHCPRCRRLTQRVSSVALFVHFLSRSKMFCDNFGARLLSAGWTDDNNCSTASQQQIMIILLARLEGEISDWLLH